MAKWVVFASGTGTNFRALVAELASAGHTPSALVSDVPECFAVEFANSQNIPVILVPYNRGSKQETERLLLQELAKLGKIQLLVLAGYMRILSPFFLRSFSGPVINIHPSLLPRHPGKHGLHESFRSQDSELGVTIHYVDEGVDTGEIIVQESFVRDLEDSPEKLEARIHAIEHRLYPQVVRELLKQITTSSEEID